MVKEWVSMSRSLFSNQKHLNVSKYYFAIESPNLVLKPRIFMYSCITSSLNWLRFCISLKDISILTFQRLLMLFPCRSVILGGLGFFSFTLCDCSVVASCNCISFFLCSPPSSVSSVFAGLPLLLSCFRFDSAG